MLYTVFYCVFYCVLLPSGVINDDSDVTGQLVQCSQPA